LKRGNKYLEKLDRIEKEKHDALEEKKKKQ
jgi:hypothetical protein